MPYGLKQIPRTEFGANFGVAAADLASDFVLPPATISQGTLSPDKIGVTMANKTGLTITPGQLVYSGGYDTTLATTTAVLADADAGGKRATWVALATILNNASGAFGLHYTLTLQNTNAGSVGDPVYLSTTAGGYTLTAPSAANALVQIIGYISVKSATVGQIEVILLPGAVPVKIGSNEYQAASIAGVALTANQQLDRQNIVFPTIATTGATSARLIISKAGTIGGFKAVFGDALTANNSNYITWTVTNLGGTSGGTTAMLAATAANTTQSTGGTGIAVDTAWVFTVSGTGSNLVVVAGDMLKITATVTGTLANSVSGGTFSAANVPT